MLHDRSSAQIQKGLALMDKLLEKDVAKVRSQSRLVSGQDLKSTLILGED